MSNILRAPNGNGLLLTPRTGSHSLALAAMQSFWPEIEIADSRWHPAGYFGVQEYFTGGNENVAVIVRNPIERFRSMIAHRHLDVAEQLSRPMYGPLPDYNFVRYFKFETELDDAADWLGITVPLTQEDATLEFDKPTLTPEQEARVREIYAADIALWGSL
jgi:hypothetical protein